MVASVGLHRSPSVTGSILKGKEQGNERERGRYWLGRCRSLGNWWPWSFPCRLSVSWPLSASIGRTRLLGLSAKGKSRATKAGRNWSPWLLVRSMSFPWQLVAVVIGSVASSIRGGSLGVDVIPLLALHPWPVSASSRASVRPRCRGLHRSPSVTGSILKGKEQGNERERPLLARLSMSFPRLLVAVVIHLAALGVVPVCGLDVVASIGRPRLLALSAKGNEQGNESRAQLVASVTGSVDVIPLLVLSVTSVGSRCHSLGNWWPRLLGGQCRPP